MMEKLHVHDSFWLLISIGIILDTTGILWCFLLAAAIHELGHWFFIRICHGRVICFQVSAAGGKIQYHLPGLSTQADLYIALGGPMFGLLLWLVAGILQWELLSGASLLLSLFNLLPISSLDGGRALDAIFPPGHPIPQMLAIFFSALVLLLGIYAGICHNGWGLCFIGLTLMLERQIGLNSIRIRGKI